MAGLTAAAYLSRDGRKTILVEKNDQCGGLVGSFDRDGFLFDAGIRAIEDAGIIQPMLRDLGISVEFVRSPVSVGVEQEILNIDGVEDLEEYRGLLERIFPENCEDINGIVATIRSVMREMEVLYGVENPMFRDLRNDRKYLFRVLMPWLLKFLVTVRRINRMGYPVEQFLEKATSNASLRDIISQHFFRGTPTFFAMSYFSLYLDYIYPKEGTGTLPTALERYVVEHGGTIVTGTEIREVVPSELIARDSTGAEYRYKSLVWAADLKTLYRIVHADGLSARTAWKISRRRELVESRRGSDSVFVLFLAVDEPPESFSRIAHGHFFYTPSRQGLGEIHRDELDSMIRNWDKVSRDDVLAWLDRFCLLNTYEVSIPVLKNPAAAPEGKTGLIISVLFEYDLARKVDDAGWHEEFCTEVEDRMVSVLSNSIYPMLKGNVISRHSYSPLGIERRVGSSDGAITGWSFQEPVPAVNRMQTVSRSVVTPIPHVLQAGQWAYSPGGVPMSVLTGRLAAAKAIKATRKSEGSEGD
jgi:phytoene dehydrogenase-like protein